MKILSQDLPNIPWQEPASSSDVVWRHSENPIVPRSPNSAISSVYNSAVVPWEDGFVGVFRAEDRMLATHLHKGVSSDGIQWEIEPTPISFSSRDPERGVVDRAYDPRVCKIGDDHFITWCHGLNGGATVGLGKTSDFSQFEYLGNAFLPYNRNGVLFPKKIGGNFAMLSRPSDNGHTPYGNIFYSESPDLEFWGKHHFIMAAGRHPWELIKIGPGPTPIETSEGWLMIYHGVRGLCNGFIYSMGAALLDLEKPWKVLARCKHFLLTPEMPYEVAGVTSNVIFPCSALTDGATNRIAIYYGAADCCLGLAYTTLDRLVNYIRKNAE
ncbi:MAG: glycoside hydrolase family 130 protein [Chthoniobacterales bacterium]